jgi:dynein heavy chain 1, cytosolic
MDAEMPNLQARITSEEKVLDEKIKDIEDIWKNQRPFSGEMLPNQAIDVLNMIETRLQKVKENYFRVCKAKDLLNLEPGKPEKLETLEEDVTGLKEIWGELSKVWGVIDSMRDTPLNALVPKKIKQSLDDALEQLNAFPSRLRTYEAFDKMKSRLGLYKKMNMLILELKNEAMKPRHWKTLLHKIKLQVSLNDLTLGQLWGCDLLKYENPIKEILTVARGELVLEEMLRNIKEYWGAFEIELVSYQNKCRLIKGWDELFAKVDEDLNNLSSMKISPYYKSFEEEIAPWDDKLQKIRIIFDIWIDVQRRWVYLEGIFFGSSDIKQQLSNEYTRFKGIDSEFTSLMKRVSSKPLIMDVLSIPSLQKTLERLADLLAKIQKALGDYLEMQRTAFARFYFVGDEDLLEIIGNLVKIRRTANKLI